MPIDGIKFPLEATKRSALDTLSDTEVINQNHFLLNFTLLGDIVGSL